MSTFEPVVSLLLPLARHGILVLQLGCNTQFEDEAGDGSGGIKWMAADSYGDYRSQSMARVISLVVWPRP